MPTFGETGRTTLCYRPKRCGASNVRSRQRGRAPHAQTDGPLPRGFGRGLLPCRRYLPHENRSKPISWNIYKIDSKTVWRGEVEALDESGAMVKAAAEFQGAANRLMALRR